MQISEVDLLSWFSMGFLILSAAFGLIALCMEFVPGRNEGIWLMLGTACVMFSGYFFTRLRMDAVADHPLAHQRDTPLLALALVFLIWGLVTLCLGVSSKRYAPPMSVSP